jgi:hypothetical protein
MPIDSAESSKQRVLNIPRERLGQTGDASGPLPPERDLAATPMVGRRAVRRPGSMRGRRTRLAPTGPGNVLRIAETDQQKGKSTRWPTGVNPLETLGAGLSIVPLLARLAAMRVSGQPVPSRLAHQADRVRVTRH